MMSRQKSILFGIAVIVITSLIILAIKMKPEKYTKRSKIGISEKDANLYKKLAMVALSKYKKGIYSMMPKASNNIAKIMGKSRLEAYINGKPQIFPLPKDVDYDIEPKKLVEMISKLTVEKGYYVKFDLNKLEKENKDHEHSDDGSDYNVFDLVDILFINVAQYLYGNRSIFIGDIGYLIELFSEVILIQPFVNDNTWKNGGYGFVSRNPRVYSGTWNKQVVIEDSEISALGDDFYGLTALTPNTQGNWYVSAGVDNREKLVALPMSDNLGYGRSSLAVRKNLPCYNRSEGKFGQGAYIGFRGFTDWTVFPVKCYADRFTKLGFYFWGHLLSVASVVNVTDMNGQLTSVDGTLGLNFDWVAYDKTTKYILVPDGSSPERCVLYDVNIDEYTVNVNAKKFVQIIKSTNETLPIVAACFGCDGMLYALTNDYDGFQGIVVFKPDVSSDSSWILREVDTISLDVNDTLVGIAGVTDPYLAQIDNYPILTVLEINEDYFTQDNLTLHKVVPRDAYTGGSYGVSSEASEWRELGQEAYCFGGILAYNIGSNLSYYFRTRDDPIKLDHPSLIGFANYLESIGFSRDIYLPNVEVYDNQCLASNYWKYDDGDRQSVRASAHGYTLYLRDKLINDDGTVNGWMLNSLIHELVHTRQYVQLGESNYQFGCAYSEGRLYAEEEHDSSYKLHPMEREARRFTTTYKVTAEIAEEFNIPIYVPSNRDPYRYPTPRTTCAPSE